MGVLTDNAYDCVESKPGQHRLEMLVTSDQAKTIETLRTLDERGFVELYTAHYSELVRYAESMLGDDAKAKDAVQEAFLRLWKRRAAVDPRRSTRALLYKAVRNLVFNHKRDVQLHQSLLRSMKQSLSNPDPEALAGTALIGEKIGAWITELPSRRREAFELSRFHGLRYEEIAGIMGVTTKTVENHILLSLQFLRNKLNAFDPQLLQP